ncbi:MAG: C39 family peptidase [Cloacibacillus porcorum]|uniref:C39 family peptidase n=1 Tax=Cloacibacillus porcorum TaxID=1197717 RepID=UPI0023F217E5|nr:C39 family peptidase [Cloacibacillus porcorum]MCD7878288.1 C39 family peptidase [Cloacibacillus porcorum]
MKKLQLNAAITALIICCTSAAGAAERVVPFPPELDTKSAGASSYNAAGDVKDSPYFPSKDYFTLTSSNKGFTILSGFPTYQQTTEVTCGPAAALTVLYYFGNKKYDEHMLSILMDTLHEPKKGGEMGTSTSGMVKFFKSIGWKVASSLDRPQGKSYDFENPQQFKDFVLKNLKEGVPVMVENMYWGGHWRVIIGYDTMGTEKTTDDVIIFMDSYDVLDHRQDGYAVQAAEGFFYTWKDMEYLPKGERVQQWLTARP